MALGVNFFVFAHAILVNSTLVGMGVHNVGETKSVTRIRESTRIKLQYIPDGEFVFIEQ